MSRALDIALELYWANKTPKAEPLLTELIELLKEEKPVDEDEKESATIVVGAESTTLTGIEILARTVAEHEAAIAKLRADLDEVMRHTNFLGVPRMPGGRQ